jgi:hypothetical protein
MPATSIKRILDRARRIAANIVEAAGTFGAAQY